MISTTVIVRGGPGSGRYPAGSGDNKPDGGGGNKSNVDVDTSGWPLARGAAWKSLKREDYRDMLREQAADGDTVEIAPALDDMYACASSDAFIGNEEKQVYFGLDGAKFADMEVGAQFEALGSRSTADSPDRAAAYAGESGAVFSLTIEPGQKSVNAKVLGERETVLFPGAKFTVTAIDEKGVKQIKMTDDGTAWVSDLYNFQQELNSITEKANSKKSLFSVSITKGGEGSGNFGHAGIPGQVGGSAPGNGSISRAKATDTAGSQRDSFTDSNISTIGSYVEDPTINYALRGSWSELSESDMDTITALDETFDAIGTLEDYGITEDIEVFRTAANTDYIPTNVGDSYKDEGYVSTTLTEDKIGEIAENLAPALGVGPKDMQTLKIIVPKERKALFVMNKYGESTMEGLNREDEILLPRGRTYTVVSRTLTLITLRMK